jgi:hypothetical protein
MKIEVITNEELGEIVDKLYTDYIEEKLALEALNLDLKELEIEYERSTLEYNEIKMKWLQLYKLQNKLEQDQLDFDEFNEHFKLKSEIRKKLIHRFYELPQEIKSKSTNINELLLKKQHGFLLLQIMNQYIKSNLKTIEEFYAIDFSSILRTDRRLGYFKIELTKHYNQQPFRLAKSEVIIWNEGCNLNYLSGSSLNLNVKMLNQLYSNLARFAGNSDFDLDFDVINNKYQHHVDLQKIQIIDSSQEEVSHRLTIQLIDINIDYKWDGEVNNAPHRIKYIIKEIVDLV